MAREKGRQANCLSNLRQIATGLLMYTDASNEVLPVAEFSETYGDNHGTYLHKVLAPHLGNDNVFQCPTLRTIPGENPHSYAYLCLHAWAAYGFDNETQGVCGQPRGRFRKPAEKPVVFETVTFVLTTRYPSPLFNFERVGSYGF